MYVFPLSHHLYIPLCVIEKADRMVLIHRNYQLVTIMLAARAMTWNCQLVTVGGRQ